MDPGPVLGLQQLRAAFLDDLPAAQAQGGRRRRTASPAGTAHAIGPLSEQIAALLLDFIEPTCLD